MAEPTEDRDPEPVLLVEQLGAVRRLTLNRPEKRNAMSVEMMAGIVGQLNDAELSLDTSVIVIRGAGSCFGSGWDLRGLVMKNEFNQRDDRTTLRWTASQMRAIYDCPLPVIAQVHGFCLAGAADMVLHCDILLIADDALFGHPPVRSLGVPSTNMWLYRAGPQVAKRLLFTGDSISGVDAAKHGIALSSYPAGDLDLATMALAQRMALTSRDMLMANKRVMNFGLDLMGRAALQYFSQAEDALAHLSPDAYDFREQAKDRGLPNALRERDARFGGRGPQTL